MSNRELLINFIFTVFHTATYIFFVIAPFKSKLRFGTKKTTTIAFIYIALSFCMFLNGFNRDLLVPEFQTHMLIAWTTLTIVGCFLCIKTNPLELLFSIFIILGFQGGSIVFTKALHQTLYLPYFKPWQYKLDSYVLSLVVLLLIIVPLLWFLFIRLFKKVVEKKIEFRFWRYLWVTPILFYLSMYISNFYGVGHDGSYELRDILTLILVVGVSYSAYVVSLQMLIKTHESYNYTKQTQIMTKQLEMQKIEYAKLVKGLVKSSHMRHDWRHHLMVLNGYVRDKKYTQLEEYLSEYMHNEFNENDAPLCSNPTVDIILRHFIAQAREQSIGLTYAVNIPENISTSDLSLCVIFGNLIENALEACERQKNGVKFIKIKTTVMGEQLFILVQNSYNSPINLIEEKFYSSKRNSEGIGISSVKSIAENSGGTLTVNSENNIFTVNVLLNFVYTNKLSEECSIA